MLIYVIANTTAGGYRPALVEDVCAYFSARSATVRLCPCDDLGDSIRFAREAVAAGADLVAVGGGDGTINEVVNGLAGSPVPMAVIPMGSVNVLALEVGIPAGALDAARVALEGTPRRIALGSAGGKLFVLMASVGFDAEVVYGVDLRLKAKVGTVAYAVAAMRRLCRPALPKLSVRLEDGTTHTGGGVIISNGRLYGGRAVLAPDADLTAPELHVCLFRGRRRLDLLRYAFAIARGTHLRRRDVFHTRTRTADIDAGGARAHVQVDGDVIGVLPMPISASESHLYVMVPEGS